VICCLFIITVWAQESDLPHLIETDDPDERSYSILLLDQLFNPINIAVADSASLCTKGYTKDAAKLIVAWQAKGSTEKGYKKLHKDLRGDDLALLYKSYRGKDRLTTIKC